MLGHCSKDVVSVKSLAPTIPIILLLEFIGDTTCKTLLNFEIPLKNWPL